MKIGSFSRALNHRRRKKVSSNKNLAFFAKTVGASEKEAQQNELAMVMGAENPFSKKKSMHNHQAI